MKKYVPLMLLLVWGALSLLGACSQRDVDTPVIDQVSPTEGQVKSEITITGNHFIDTYSQTYVRFNGSKAEPKDFVSITDTEIVIRVPNEGTSGPLDIKISDKTSNSVDFTVYGPWLYVVFDSNSISVVDSYNNNIKDTITLDSTPQKVAFTPEGDKAYILNYSDPEIVVVDAPTNQVMATVTLSANPVDMAISTRKQHRAFISHGAAGGITVLDTLTDTVETVLTAGTDPGDLLVDSETERLFVANRGDRTVQVFSVEDLNLMGTSTALEGTPGKLYINPGKDRLISLNSDDATVSIYRTNTAELLATIPVGENPVSGIFDQEGDYFYVVNNGSNTVSVINVPKTDLRITVNVGTAPFDAALHPTGTYVYVSNSGEGTVTAILVSNLSTTTIEVGSDPCEMGSVDGPGENMDRIFVLNRGSGTISVINAEDNVVEATITVGDGPLSMFTEDLTTYPPDEEDIVQR